MGLLVPAPRVAAERSDLSGDAQVTATSGVTITGSATPHSLGASPTTIIAATAIEAGWIEIVVHSTAQPATLTDALLNIYIGAASSEVLLIDSLQCGSAPSIAASLLIRYWFPLRIPAGTRISGSIRGLIASETVEVTVTIGSSNGQHWVGSGVETLGEVTASSRGTSIIPQTSASWQSLGTTGRRYRYIVLGVQGNNDVTANSTLISWSIGVSSVLLQGLDKIFTFITSNESHEIVDSGRWCDIPSGTALQVRGWASATPSGAVYVTLHGVY